MTELHAFVEMILLQEPVEDC